MKNVCNKKYYIHTLFSYKGTYGSLIKSPLNLRISNILQHHSVKDVL